MTGEERAVLQAVLDDMHEQFIGAVAEGRRLSRDAVRALADGRLYTGRRAKELGLVDALGGLDEAVRQAGLLAGIEGPPRVVRPPRALGLPRLLDWLGAAGPGGLGGGLPVLPLGGIAKVPLYVMD
jgi:protease-4